MAFKFIILAAFVAVASAGNLRSADLLLPSSSIAIDGQYARLAPAEAHYVASEGSNPAYEFKYGVHDQFTGDSKSAHEVRNGDLTQGTYSVNDPDGTRRTVDYFSTPLTGFQATVRKEPLVEAVLPAAEPILAKTLVEAPIAAPLPAVELRAAPLIAKAATIPAGVEFRSAPLISNSVYPAGLELRSAAPYYSGALPAAGFVQPNLLRSYALPAGNLLRSNLHLAPELRYGAAPLVRHAAPIAYTRTDAGLIAPVAAGFAAAGVRSYTTHNAPVLYNNW